MKTEFMPIDFSCINFEGKNYVRMIGRSETGKRVCVIDLYEPNFWVILKDNLKEEKIKQVEERIRKIEVNLPSRTTKVTKTEVHSKKFLGKDVKAIKIFISDYKDGHAVADMIDFKEVIARREYDINPITKYIMEKKVVPMNWIEVEGEESQGKCLGKSLNVESCIVAEKISKSEKDRAFKPKIVAFDIETEEFEIGKGEILMISIYGEKLKKVLTWKKCEEKQDYVECLKDEAAMIKKFLEYVKKESPDFLVGYFSDGFDMPYLRARANQNKINLSLGLDKSQPSFARGRISSARINGIVHVDLFRFIETAYSQSLQSETLGLNEVAMELLGDGKKEFEFKKADKINGKEWKNYFEYNLQDSALTYKLAEKIWQDILEFSRVIREPVFEVTRDGMSQMVENYILHNLDRFNEIAEKRPIHEEIQERRARKKYEGAYVFQPTPGLYEDLAIFDFTSMHASIIVSYNLSKSTLLEKQEKDCYESPEFELNGKKIKCYFSKEDGFFPLLLKEIVGLRKKYKKELKEKPDPIKRSRSNAFKLLANAYYGYLGFFGARYYSIESAASTLALVRKFNKEIIDKVNNNNFKVIFGDTDSVGFLLNEQPKKDVSDFLKKLNSELPGIMELELEDFYQRGIWVTKRTGEFGAKKKYALVDYNGKMKIRGFETVRRDWCRLARNLQNQVLQKILEDGNEKSAMELLKEVVTNLKKRKVDKKDILIRTQLKKQINEYKSRSPHVIAAEKMEQMGLPVHAGAVMEFYIAETREAKKLVREKVKLPQEEGEYNIEYYLNNQVLPAVENIFEVFGIDVNSAFDENKQMTLGSF